MVSDDEIINSCTLNSGEICILSIDVSAVLPYERLHENYAFTWNENIMFMYYHEHKVGEVVLDVEWSGEFDFKAFTYFLLSTK